MPAPASTSHTIIINNHPNHRQFPIYLDDDEKNRLCTRSTWFNREIIHGPHQNETVTTLQDQSCGRRTSPEVLEQLVEILKCEIWSPTHPINYQTLLSLCLAIWEYQCDNAAFKECPQVEALRGMWMVNHPDVVDWNTTKDWSDCEGWTIISLVLDWDDVFERVSKAVVLESIVGLDPPWDSILPIEGTSPFQFPAFEPGIKYDARGTYLGIRGHICVRPAETVLSCTEN